MTQSPVSMARDFLIGSFQRGTLTTLAAAAFPVVVLVSSLAFYIVLFQNWNSAPVFSERATVADPGDTFSFGVDLCRVTPSKVHVEAWVALKGHQRGTHESSLLVRDNRTRQHVRMKSRVVLRPDVSRTLNDRYEDRINYDGTGLQGSLNFQKGGRAITHGQVVAAYDTGSGFILVELPCGF